MSSQIVFFLLLSGAAAGFLAGLLGIGGGLIIVPAILWLVGDRAGEYSIHVAVATSLATIVVTGAVSTVSHHRRGAVDWAIWRRMSIGLLAGSGFAALVAPVIPEVWLRGLFVAFCLAAAIQMASSHRGQGSGERPAGAPRWWEYGSVGVVFGAMSAWTGIGGGSLNVPYLSWRWTSTHVAVGTAAALGLPIALFGAAGYALAAPVNLPGPSIGLIYLPGFAAIVITSMLTAPLGAAAAHNLPVNRLRQVFAVFLVVVAVTVMI